MIAQRNRSAVTRKEAEERLRRTSGDLKVMPIKKVQDLVYELQIHQIELEMQNEALRDAQEELEASRNRYVDLYDFAPVGYLTLDGDGKILEANLMASTMLGVTRAELAGLPFSRFITHESQDTFYMHRRLALMAGKEIPCELKLVQKAGHEPFYVQLHSVAIEGAENCFRTAITNITEQKKLEAQLIQSRNEAQRANVAKSDFLANMSHEIRTPLNAVIGLAGILTRMCKEDDKNAIYLLTMKDSAEALLELVNNMLDFAKIESSMLTLDHYPFELDELVREVHRMAGVKAKEKHLDLMLEYDTGLPKTFMGDAARLRQILINLVNNAIKFTEHGSVTLRVTGALISDDSWTVTLEVRDTGIGIQEEKVEQMFGKFTQQDTSISRKFGGTGLGLAICRELTRLMQGQINVKSRIGEGSSFTLTLPLSLSDVKPLSLPAPTEEVVLVDYENARTSDQPFRILLVEDSTANVMVTTSILDELGYQYEVAWNGFEALERLERQSFDLILMDVQMPSLNGFEITRILRYRETERSERHMPIIAMTAHAFEEDRQRCLKAGMDDYLSKPFDAAEFRKKLEQFC